ncbi:MAG: hypothetical protein ACKO0W_10945, partial [Planctomycetota bacterium]
MQRSTMIEPTFITTFSSRTAAGLVAVALVGTTPWMAPWSQSTLAQDAPATEPPVEMPQALPADATAAVRAEARAAASRSEWKKAIDLWSAVLATTPGDAEAMAGMRRAQAALDQGSILNDVGTDIALRRQKAEVEVGAQVADATQALNNGDYTTAERAALGAKMRLGRDKGVFPGADFDAMTAKIDGLLEQIAISRTNAQLSRDEEARRSASQAASERQKNELESRQKQINERLVR